MLDILFQLVKHTERFVLEFDQGVSLTNRAEMDACAQNIHSIDMIHPQTVYNLQDNGTLYVTNGRNAKPGMFFHLLIQFLATFLVVVHHEIYQFFAEIIAAYSMQVLWQDL